MKDRVCYSLSQEGIVTWISRNVSEMIGWRPEEVIGKHFFSFIVPEHHEEIVRRREGRLAGVTDEYATEIIRKDGTKEAVRIRALQTPENTVGMIDRRLKTR